MSDNALDIQSSRKLSLILHFRSLPDSRFLFTVTARGKTSPRRMSSAIPPSPHLLRLGNMMGILSLIPRLVGHCNSVTYRSLSCIRHRVICNRYRSLYLGRCHCKSQCMIPREEGRNCRRNRAFKRASIIEPHHTPHISTIYHSRLLYHNKLRLP
jgi:hypothetical protein